jgi:RimJ/RimL family protein N-acetyltransferase
VIAVAGFETARMRAEPIGPEHRDGLIALLGDPRVGATLSGIADPDAVDAQICRMTARWERDGFGLYAFLDRDTGALVARGGPQRCHVAGRDDVEVGWTVVPERWNQGFATELGAASIEVAFGPLALPDVVSFTLPDNRASRRVMEKLGFAYERDTVYAGRPHVLYRLSASSARRVEVAGEAQRAAAARSHHAGLRQPLGRAVVEPRHRDDRRVARRQPEARAQPVRRAHVVHVDRLDADVRQQRERRRRADPAQPRRRDVEAAGVGRQAQRRAVVGGVHILARIAATASRGSPALRPRRPAARARPCARRARRRPRPSRARSSRDRARAGRPAPRGPPPAPPPSGSTSSTPAAPSALRRMNANVAGSSTMNEKYAR